MLVSSGFTISRSAYMPNEPFKLRRADTHSLVPILFKDGQGALRIHKWSRFELSMLLGAASTRD